MCNISSKYKHSDNSMVGAEFQNINADGNVECISNSSNRCKNETYGEHILLPMCVPHDITANVLVGFQLVFIQSSLFLE